jgi:hypothetical protein
VTTHKRGTAYALRYADGTDLARRYPEPAGRFRTREEAERLRALCVNAEHIEVVELRLRPRGKP